MKSFALLFAVVAVAQAASYYPEHHHQQYYQGEQYGRYWPSYGKHGVEHKFEQEYVYPSHVPEWNRESQYHQMPVDRDVYGKWNHESTEYYQNNYWKQYEKYPTHFSAYEKYPTHFSAYYGQDYHNTPYQYEGNYQHYEYSPYQQHFEHYPIQGEHYPYGQYHQYEHVPSTY